MQVGELGGGEEGGDGGGHSVYWVGMVGGWEDSSVVGWIGGKAGGAGGSLGADRGECWCGLRGCRAQVVWLLL